MKKILLTVSLAFISIMPANSMPAQHSRKEIVSMLFKAIEDWYGTRYVLGGTSKAGIDCSGLVAQIYKEVFDIDLPRRVSEQKKLGELVKGKLQPGDVVFFNINGDGISHEGIYVFNNKFVQAASAGPATGVVKSSLEEPYYKKRFAFAKRFIKLPPYRVYSDNDPKPKLILGKYIYKNIIFNISEEYEADEKIYMQVKSNEPGKYNVNVINGSNELIKKINFDDINDYCIRLDSGKYRIELADGDRKLSEKNILVK